jgi:hypothetical protein
MSKITINETATRILYAGKQYKISSKTGFSLYRRFLRENDMVHVHKTSKKGLFFFNGNSVDYLHPNYERIFHFTENSKVGRFYIEKIRKVFENGSTVAQGQGSVD